MLQIPGYVYNEQLKRYFKVLPGSKVVPSVKGKEKEPVIDTPPPQKRQKRSHFVLDSLQQSSSHSLSYARLQRKLRNTTPAYFTCAYTEYPECITQGDTIQQLCICSCSSDTSPIFQLGTADGMVAKGKVRRAQTNEDNVSNWRTLSFLGSTITSLHFINSTQQSFFTSFGPNPKAHYDLPSTLHSDNGFIMHPKSIQLSPKKTSIWTSLLCDNGRVVLGCDKYILTCKNIKDDQPEQFYTGSSVFALTSPGGDIVYAGTRSGTVQLLDTSSHPTNRKPFHNTIIKLQSSITNLSLIDSTSLLVATMDGTLQIYNTQRLKPSKFHSARPVLSLQGHVNTLSRYLGLAVSPDQKFVAAAGEDCKIRIWSLINGERVQALSRLDSLLGYTFEGPVKAILWLQTDDGNEQIWTSDGPALKCWELF